MILFLVCLQTNLETFLETFLSQKNTHTYPSDNLLLVPNPAQNIHLNFFVWSSWIISRWIWIMVTSRCTTWSAIYVVIHRSHNQMIDNLLLTYISSNMHNQPIALIVAIYTIHLLTSIGSNLDKKPITQIHTINAG